MNEHLDLRYFAPHEFHGWWTHINDELLLALDAYREALGKPVHISPAAGSVGRRAGIRNTSKHNVDLWGEVLAVDVMPEAPLDEAYRVARELNLFHGIGVYPHWQDAPDHIKPGLHLDMREGREARHPAEWGGIKDHKGVQQYVSLQAALEQWRLETNRET